jgi:hypothetical protein
MYTISNTNKKQKKIRNKTKIIVFKFYKESKREKPYKIIIKYDHKSSKIQKSNRVEIKYPFNRISKYSCIRKFKLPGNIYIFNLDKSK